MRVHRIPFISYFDLNVGRPVELYQLEVLVRKFNSLIGFEAIFVDYVESFICQCIILIRLNKYTSCRFLSSHIRFDLMMFRVRAYLLDVVALLQIM